MRMIKIASILLLSTTLHAWAETTAPAPTSIEIPTPRGAKLKAFIHLPASDTPAPAVVIGPGQGYHMDLPLVKTLAEKVAGLGYAAIRFNWNYHTEGGRPSADLSSELEDFAAAVNFAKAHEKIDAEKIIVAGKSLGTFLAYRHFKTDSSVRGLALLTPVCTWRWDDEGNELEEPIATGAENYPTLPQSDRPVVVALGNRDPICSVPMMYDFLKDSNGNVATLVLEGDHSMNIGHWSDPAYEDRNAANVYVGTYAVAHWIKLMIDRL